jgi:ParB/RepB/Spo0J family partition protein
MGVTTLNGAASSSLTARLDLVPCYLDTDLVVSPPDNPIYTPAKVADLVASFQKHGQLVPGFVCPSPELAEGKRFCVEGNRRLYVARMLGTQFWTFDLGRFVPEEERIMLTFQHNHSRRVMTREEMAERAARFMEIRNCTSEAAAEALNVSPATLSRAFGERRIPAELRPRADALGLSIRSLIAAMPADLMEPVIAFAETPEASKRKPTRDAVTQFIDQLKTKGGVPRARKPRTLTLRMNGRVVTFTVTDTDSAATVSEDFRAIMTRLGKHADVSPDGWPFLFS